MDILEYFRFLMHTIFVRKQIYTRKEDSVFSIDYAGLKKKGIRLLIFDVDDTLTTNLGDILEKETRLLKKLSKSFRIAIFSNCTNSRRKKLTGMLSGLDLYIAPMGGKPGKHGFIHINETLRIRPENTAMIGDRMGTDMWGAYITGIKERILVNIYSSTFHKHGFFSKVFKRSEK